MQGILSPYVDVFAPISAYESMAPIFICPGKTKLQNQEGMGFMQHIRT
jgi:hypothetical protein